MPFSGSRRWDLASSLRAGPRNSAPPGRPGFRRDEFLCDGGDHAEPAHFGGDGGLLGIDPRDAVIQFSDTKRRGSCRPTWSASMRLGSPRFVLSIGPNEAPTVEGPRRAELVEAQAALLARQESKRLVKNELAEANRHRARASGMTSRVFAGAHTELRVLNGFSLMTHLSRARLVQGPELSTNRQKTIGLREDIAALGIKTAEGPWSPGSSKGRGRRS